ncbi:MAG: MOSC domain-containing protein [Acidobacteriota bacterium]
MRIVSLNVGLPREVSWQGKSVTTGIFKYPVASPLMLRTLNLDGDQQADLTVHGGKDKAVYAYPHEHFAYWRNELPEVEFVPGMFGENLTTEGLLEDEVFIGDRMRIGAAEVTVSQPRLPCYKLTVKFERADMVKRFLASRRTGFYFAVAKEGIVTSGDEIEVLSRDPSGVRVSDITRVYAFDKQDRETMERALGVAALPDSWKDYLRDRLSR